MTRLILFALLALLLPIHSSSTSAGETKKLTIKWYSEHFGDERFTKAIEAFKTLVQKESGGELDLEFVYRTKHGAVSNRDIIYLVQSGEYQMGHAFTYDMDDFDNRLLLFYTPHLFRDYEHLEKFFESPLPQELLVNLPKKGFRGLAFAYSGGEYIIGTRHKPMRRIEDFAGMQLEGMRDFISKQWFSKLGANYMRNAPVGVSSESLAFKRTSGARDLSILSFTGSLKRDTTAMVSTYTRFDLDHLEKKDLKYVTEMGHAYRTSLFMVNEKFFQSLTPHQQQALQKAATLAAKIERDTARELDRATRKRYIEKGVKIVRLSPEERESFEKLARPMHSKIADFLGLEPDYLKKIEALGTQTVGSSR